MANLKEMFVAIDHRQSSENLPTYIHSIYMESFDAKAVKSPADANEWLYYNIVRDGSPPPPDMKLPAQLVMVCKSIKGFEQDFFVDLKSDAPLWIVSEKFYDLIREQGFFNGMYEACSVDVLSDKGQCISTKKHYVMRFFRTHDTLIDFEGCPKAILPSKGRPGLPVAYYTNLLFKEGYEIPELLVLTDPLYVSSFIATTHWKEHMEREQFLGIEFHSISGFSEEQLYREKNMPSP